MKTDKEHVVEIYRMMLRHYFEKGLGEQSELSTNTTITPKLVKSVLDRYLELGGKLDFLEIKEIEYLDFLEEMKAC